MQLRSHGGLFGRARVFKRSDSAHGVYIRFGIYAPGTLRGRLRGGKHKTVLADVKVKDANGEKIYKAGVPFYSGSKKRRRRSRSHLLQRKDRFRNGKIPAIIARENGKVYGYKYFVGDTEMSYNDENGEKYRRGGVASVVKADSDRAGWFSQIRLSPKDSKFSFRP